MTGHRSLVATTEVVQAIDEALSRISGAFPGTPLTIVSPLAEGADRLVVARAFARGHRRLIVPLPLPAADYLRSFTSPDSERAFLALLEQADEVIELPPAATDVEAYHAAGRWILDHVDALVAVWDGQPPQGAGGTGGIVEEARARGLPVAWVHPPDGRVTYERL